MLGETICLLDKAKQELFQTHNLNQLILRRHLAWKMSCFCMMVFLTFQALEPYRRTPIMSDLNILILVGVLRLDDQMFGRFAKFVRAFVILYWTSMVESPLDVILLPRYTKALTTFIMLLFAVTSMSLLKLIFINFVFLSFILNLIFLLYLTRSSVLLWIS